MSCPRKTYADCAVQTSPRRTTQSPNQQDSPLHLQFPTSHLDEDPLELPVPKARKPRIPSQWPQHPLATLAWRSASLPKRLVLDTLAEEEEGPPQTLRFVSMPDYPVRSKRNWDQDSSSKATPFLTLDDDYAQIIVSPRTPEMPHTPSPPSSPDSVEMIEDGSHLPDVFLRVRSGSDIMNSNIWTVADQSPPRPIPALHGPSSLPYARCPSGAEGTVIEEQATVPRLIWGLQTRAETPGSAPSPYLGDVTSVRPAAEEGPLLDTNVNGPTGPERHRGRTDGASFNTEVPTYYYRERPTHTSPKSNIPYLQTSRQTTNGPSVPQTLRYGRQEDHHNGNLPGPRTSQQRTEPGTSSAVNRAKHPNYLTPSLGHGYRQPTDLQPGEVFCHFPLPTPNRYSHPNSVSNFQGPSHKEPMLGQNNRIYIQNQYGLPTPPNSSSPIWSPNVASYAQHFPIPSEAHNRVPNLQQHLDLSQELRRFVHERVTPPSFPTGLPTPQDRAPGFHIPPSAANYPAAYRNKHTIPINIDELLPGSSEKPNYLLPRTTNLNNPARLVDPSFAPNTQPAHFGPSGPLSNSLSTGHPRHLRSLPLARLLEHRLSAGSEGEWVSPPNQNWDDDMRYSQLQDLLAAASLNDRVQQPWTFRHNVRTPGYPTQQERNLMMPERPPVLDDHHVTVKLPNALKANSNTADRSAHGKENQTNAKKRRSKGKPSRSFALKA